MCSEVLGEGVSRGPGGVPMDASDKEGQHTTSTVNLPHCPLSKHFPSINWIWWPFV